ncbi:DUF2382 domain-containing protein [Saccharomonospora iraqiensis]|uniref:DUF2382 domain-containing protein n=1 Tax=Saccharomonospora iraqiensis TaxID=52698 RepID=UPI00022DF906|nr:PRC and DUF2382 domain-containing protein [Saccharomonospora iraqiensis]
MATTPRPEELVDSSVLDSQGRKIGKVGTVYLSDETRNPEWVTVRTGMLGHKESFVPLQGSHMENDGIHVQVSKDQVSNAPSTDTDSDLSGEESAELYRHYDMPAPRAARPEESTGTAEGTGTAAGTTAGTAAGETGRQETGTTRGRSPEEESMVRSEERMRAGTDEVESGRVRLRKYVVTEEQQMKVPVSHEEVRVEREPITEEDRAEAATGELGEEEQEVTLHSEQPHVEKESVPVEKVRLGKERVAEEETVSGEVRKEQFDIDEEGGSGTRGGGTNR